MTSTAADQALTNYANGIADMLEAAIARFGDKAPEALMALMSQ